MANSTYGRLIPKGDFTGSYSLRTSNGSYGGGARLIGVGGNRRGAKSISGYTHSAGSNVKRRLILLTQGPPSEVVFDGYSTLDGLYSFAKLAAGTYMVIDVSPTNAEQALIYDWVVAGP